MYASLRSHIRFAALSSYARSVAAKSQHGIQSIGKTMLFSGKEFPSPDGPKIPEKGINPRKWQLCMPRIIKFAHFNIWGQLIIHRLQCSIWVIIFIDDFFGKRLFMFCSDILIWLGINHTLFKKFQILSYLFAIL